MMKKKWNYKKLLEMLENKKSLFKPLNKDFIKIKCCKFCRTFCRTTKFFKLKHQVLIYSNTWCSNGANEVVIYNFLALITIDTNINQFIKVYHIFYKIQDQFKKYIKPIKKPGFKSEEEQTCSFVLIIHNKFVYSH